MNNCQCTHIGIPKLRILCVGEGGSDAASVDVLSVRVGDVHKGAEYASMGGVMKGMRYVRRPMAYRSDNLARTPESVGKCDVDRIQRKVANGSPATDVEDSVVLGLVDIFERDSGGQLVDDHVVLEEARRFFVLVQLDG